MQRLTETEAQAVAENRRLGRTDRQIEHIVGLAYGTLSRPWTVATECPKAKAARLKAHADWQAREDAFWRSVFRPDRHLRGWRPDGDCVTSRPNAAPLRSVPRKPRAEGNR